MRKIAVFCSLLLLLGCLPRKQEVGTPTTPREAAKAGRASEQKKHGHRELVHTQWGISSSLRIAPDYYSLGELQACLDALEKNPSLMNVDSRPNRWKETELRDDVLMAIGTKYARALRYGEARKRFQEVVDRFPDSWRRLTFGKPVLVGSIGASGEEWQVHFDAALHSYQQKHRNHSALSAGVCVAQTYMQERQMKKALDYLKALSDEIEKKVLWSEDELKGKEKKATLAKGHVRNRPDKVALHLLTLVAIERGDSACARRTIALMRKKFPKSSAKLATFLVGILAKGKDAVYRELDRFQTCPADEVWYKWDVEDKGYIPSKKTWFLSPDVSNVVEPLPF